VAAEQLVAPDVLLKLIPNYRPPLQLFSFNSRPRACPQSLIEAFRLFITHEIVDIIVANTNSYVDDHREAVARLAPYSRPQLHLVLLMVFMRDRHRGYI
jgi:hypothetical protein